MTTLLIIAGVGFVLVVIAAAVYLSRIISKTNSECIKLINLCETIYDLNSVTNITTTQHFKENLFKRDPIKLYPQHIRERYYRKHG